MKWHTRLGLSLENDLLSPPSRPWSGSIPIESPCWIAYNYVRSSSASPLRRRRPQKIRPERKICNFDNQSHERRLIFTIQRAFIYIYISHGNNDETLLLLLENPFDTRNLAIFCIFVFIIYTKVFIHQVSLQLFYISFVVRRVRRSWSEDNYKSCEARIVKLVVKPISGRKKEERTFHLKLIQRIKIHGCKLTTSTHVSRFLSWRNGWSIGISPTFPHDLSTKLLFKRRFLKTPFKSTWSGCWPYEGADPMMGESPSKPDYLNTEITTVRLIAYEKEIQLLIMFREPFQALLSSSTGFFFCPFDLGIPRKSRFIPRIDYRALIERFTS